MFDLKDFVFKVIYGMIGNEPDYKVRQYAIGWYDKSVLTEKDLLQIDSIIEEKNKNLYSEEDDGQNGY